MNLIQNYRKIIPFIVFIVCIFLAYVFIHIIHFLTGHDAEEVHFFIFLATLSLALIAYYEFNRSNELTSNEFLLFTSQRWNSKEIIKARQILHEIFVDAYRDKQGKAKCDFNSALFSISEKILQMSRAKGDEGKKFIYLLNLLDYLETLSYFFNRGDLKLKDVQNTCGNNAIFFYESFKLFIEQRQSHNKTFFINFTALYHDLKKPRISQQNNP